MNYGYECKGWKSIRMQMLADALKRLLKKQGLDKIPYPDCPYIEVNGLYAGVRIRKITYLSEEQRDLLIKEADRLYDNIKNFVPLKMPD